MPSDMQVIQSVNSRKAKRARIEMYRLAKYYDDLANDGQGRSLFAIAEDIRKILSATEPLETFIKPPSESALRF